MVNYLVINSKNKSNQDLNNTINKMTGELVECEGKFYMRYRLDKPDELNSIKNLGEKKL